MTIKATISSPAGAMSTGTDATIIAAGPPPGTRCTEFGDLLCAESAPKAARLRVVVIIDHALTREVLMTALEASAPNPGLGRFNPGVFQI